MIEAASIGSDDSAFGRYGAQVDTIADLGNSGIELRRAETDDDDLIRRILCIAATWRETTHPTQVPDGLDAYHEGWQRTDDIGVVAFTGIDFLGGAFARRVGPADGTYGYVSPELHEMTVGVEAGHRKKGIGRLVLEALKARTIERGLGGLSLSVELDNPARHLYKAARFELIEERPTDALMAWRSPPGVAT